MLPDQHLQGDCCSLACVQNAGNNKNFKYNLSKKFTDIGIFEHLNSFLKLICFCLEMLPDQHLQGDCCSLACVQNAGNYKNFKYNFSKKFTDIEIFEHLNSFLKLICFCLEMLPDQHLQGDCCSLACVQNAGNYTNFKYNWS